MYFVDWSIGDTVHGIPTICNVEYSCCKVVRFGKCSAIRLIAQDLILSPSTVFFTLVDYSNCGGIVCEDCDWIRLRVSSL